MKIAKKDRLSKKSGENHLGCIFSQEIFFCQFPEFTVKYRQQISYVLAVSCVDKAKYACDS
jgi:hypothetical protein